MVTTFDVRARYGTWAFQAPGVHDRVDGGNDHGRLALPEHLVADLDAVALDESLGVGVPRPHGRPLAPRPAEQCLGRRCSPALPCPLQPGCNASATPRRSLAEASGNPSREVHHGHRRGQAEEFLGRFVTDLGATAAAGNVVIGHQLGLYRALAAGPASARELAERTHTNPRYITEWLRGQAAGGYVEYDAGPGDLLDDGGAGVRPDQPGRRRLRPGRVRAGARRAAGRAADHRGVPHRAGMGWHEQDEDVFIGCEQFFRPGYIANLVPSWIPALDGVADKLQAGAKVADIGCGLGASTILLAQEYPNSRVHRVGLPRRVDRAGPQAGGRRRGRRPGELRGRLGRVVLRLRLRPGRDVRLPARHGRPAGGGPARPAGTQAERHLAGRRAVRGRRARRAT